MAKKFIVIGLAVILFAGVATVVVLFLFPYKPSQPPRVDDSGSTQQGIQAEQQEPLKSVSKTIIVNGKATTAAPTGKTILDCRDANHNVKDAVCDLNFLNSFEKNLQLCTPGKGTVAIGFEPMMQIFRGYEILGIQNNLCVINFWFLKTKDIPTTLLDKQMICKYSMSERTIEKVAKVENCAGPLLDEFNKLRGQ